MRKGRPYEATGPTKNYLFTALRRTQPTAAVTTNKMAAMTASHNKPLTTKPRIARTNQRMSKKPIIWTIPPTYNPTGG